MEQGTVKWFNGSKGSNPANDVAQGDPEQTPYRGDDQPDGPVRRTAGEGLCGQHDSGGYWNEGEQRDDETGCIPTACPSIDDAQALAVFDDFDPASRPEHFHE